MGYRYCSALIMIALFLPVTTAWAERDAQSQIRVWQDERVAPGAVTVSDVTTHWTVLNSVIIVGFVANSGPDPVTDIKITASLIGADGGDVAVVDADLRPRVLLPGTRAPWRAEVARAPFQVGARAWAEAVPLDPSDVARLAPPLYVEARAFTRERAAPYVSHLSGRIVNVGDQTVSRARVLVMLIGMDGRPVAAAEKELMVRELGPNQSGMFDLDFRLGMLPMVAWYEAAAEAVVTP